MNKRHLCLLRTLDDNPPGWIKSLGKSSGGNKVEGDKKVRMNHKIIITGKVLKKMIYL